MSRRLGATPLIRSLVATAVLAAAAAAQCPMCKQALEGDATTAGDGLVQGMADSIYLMVSLPYLLFGATAFMIWRQVRRKNAEPPLDP